MKSDQSFDKIDSTFSGMTENYNFFKVDLDSGHIIWKLDKR